MEEKTLQKQNEGDFWVLILSLAISLFGLVMVFSASYYVSIRDYGNQYVILKRTILCFIIGWLFFLLCSVIDYHTLLHLAIPALVVGFVLLGLIFTGLGIRYNNAVRSIKLIGSFHIMPGEVIKSCMILFVSAILGRDDIRIKKFKWFIGIFGIALAAAVLIYLQPNLSTAITVLFLVVGLMFFAGCPIKYFLILVAILGAAVGALAVFKPELLKDYMLGRMMNFWDPFSDSDMTGYQVIQSLYALGSGGLFGVGLGNSIQKAFYLPECDSDFIIPIIGEELGFAGILLLMLAYAALVYSIFSIALRSKDRYAMIFASGVGIHIAFQVLMNLAVVTASAPPTGIALPLVSSAGNSLILFLGELGIVYNISKSSKTVELNG